MNETEKTFYLDQDDLDDRIHRLSLAMAQNVSKKQKKFFAFGRDTGERLTKQGGEYLIPYIPEFPENAKHSLYIAIKTFFYEKAKEQNDDIFVLLGGMEEALETIDLYDFLQGARVFLPKDFCTNIERDTKDNHVNFSYSLIREIKENSKNPLYFIDLPFSTMDLLSQKGQDKVKALCGELRETKSRFQYARDNPEKYDKLEKDVEKLELFISDFYVAQVQRGLLCFMTEESLVKSARGFLSELSARILSDTTRFSFFLKTASWIKENKKNTEKALKSPFCLQEQFLLGGDTEKMAKAMADVLKNYTGGQFFKNLVSLELIALHAKTQTALVPKNTDDLPENIEIVLEMRQQNQHGIGTSATYVQTKTKPEDLLSSLDFLARDFSLSWQGIARGEEVGSINLAARVSERVVQGMLSQFSEFKPNRFENDPATLLAYETKNPLFKNYSGFFVSHEHIVRLLSPDLFLRVFSDVLPSVSRMKNLGMDDDAILRDFSLSVSGAMMLPELMSSFRSERLSVRTDSPFLQDNFWDTKFQSALASSVKETEAILTDHQQSLNYIHGTVAIQPLSSRTLLDYREERSPEPKSTVLASRI